MFRVINCKTPRSEIGLTKPMHGGLIMCVKISKNSNRPFRRQSRLRIGMSVGDYVLSLTGKLCELRQPLSNVYQRLWKVQHEPVNNGQNNNCKNKIGNDFIAENYMDLMFLRLPAAHNQSQRSYLGQTAWREEWLRCGDDFWNDLETAQTGKLGTLIETKSQYLRLVEETLQTASHIPNMGNRARRKRFCLDAGYCRNHRANPPR